MRSLILLLAGLVLGAILIKALDFLATPPASDAVNASDEPLYWVAPMDPNFRRDKPGKSPMGMDLVPVYADDNQQDSPGTVRISPDVENNLGVTTSPVALRRLELPVHTVGYVGYNEDKLVHIHPRVSGWVDSLHVKTTGEQVVKGQPLYALYSPQLVNAQEEYLLAKKRNNRDLINAALARLKALHLPDDTLNRLNNSGLVQQTVTFASPQTGVVDNLNIREGFFVEPGTTMMSIGTLDEVWVEAEVFERQSSQIKTGLTVSMSLDYLPGTQWQGEVDYVYPSLDPQTRTLRVRLRFDNQEHKLKPNMFAQVTIHTAPLNDVLLVPTQSVIRTGKQDRVVLALGEGRFKSVEVGLGQVTQHFTQVLSGIEAGDEVVTSAQFMLDSESSISSDFKRMYRNTMEDVPEVQQATVNGIIEEKGAHSSAATISREAIPKWNRDPATMAFVFSDEVDHHAFKVGDPLRFTFEIRDGEFVIVDAEVTGGDNP